MIVFVIKRNCDRKRLAGIFRILKLEQAGGLFRRPTGGLVDLAHPGVHDLREVAFTVKKRHRHNRYMGVGKTLQGISGKDAQPTAVVWDLAGSVQILVQ